MDRGNAGGGLDQGNTGGSEGSLSNGTTFTTLANVLDNGCFHSKLDEIQREEPNDVLMKWSMVYKDGERESDVPRPKRSRSNRQISHGCW